MVEQRTHKPLVAGSTPAPGTTFVSGAETKVPANLSSVALAEEEALAKAGISSSLRPLPSYRSAEINMFVLMEGEAQRCK